MTKQWLELRLWIPGTNLARFVARRVDIKASYPLTRVHSSSR